jgi:integrase
MIHTYLHEISGVLSESTVQQYGERLARFDYWMTAEGRTKYDRKVVVDFIHHMQRKEVGHASIALHKTAISAFYTWLVQNEKITSNPVPNIKIGRHRSAKTADTCMFSEAEYAAIRAACRGQKLRFDFWEGAVVIGWNTGLRMGDIACLEWSEINFSEGMIDIVPNKTKRFEKRIQIPLTPEAHRFLSDMYGQRVSGHVFPAMFAQYSEDGAKHLSQQFTRICERAGVFDKSFHHLRHTLTSRLLTKGVPLNVVSGITGHTLPVLNRYSHAEFKDKWKAMVNL